MAEILPVSQMIQTPNLLAGYQQGLQFGQQQRDRRNSQQAAQLYAQAMQAPPDQRPGLLAQIAQLTGVEGATNAQAGLGRLDTAAHDDLVQTAGQFAAIAETDPASAQQMYPALAGKAHRIGIPVPTAYDPKFLPAIQKLAGIANQLGESFTLAPGSARYDAQGHVIASQPFAPAGAKAPTYVDVPDGQGGSIKMQYDPDTGGLVPLRIGTPQASADMGPGPATTAANGQPFYDSVLASIAPLGGILGSTAGGQHNPGSLHYSGRAVDIPLGASASPEAKANADRMVATLKAQGYTVRDERTHPAGQAVWGGPHLHVEAPDGAPRLGYSPPKSADRGAYRTLSPQEVQSMGLPQGTVAQVSPSGQVQIVNKPRDLPAGGQVIDNGDGTTTYIPAGKVSDASRNAAGFYQRMVEADKELTGLEQHGYDPTNLRDQFTVGGKFLNGLASDEGQQYHQAAQNWVRANLRKESGAAIGVAEMDQEIRNYFPQIGDSPAVIAQKAHNRRVVEDAMRQAAAGALPPPAAGKPKPAASSAHDPLGIL